MKATMAKIHKQILFSICTLSYTLASMYGRFPIVAGLIDVGKVHSIVHAHKVPITRSLCECSSSGSILWSLARIGHRPGRRLRDRSFNAAAPRRCPSRVHRCLLCLISTEPLLYTESRATRFYLGFDSHALSFFRAVP